MRPLVQIKTLLSYCKFYSIYPIGESQDLLEIMQVKDITEKSDFCTMKNLAQTYQNHSLEF